MRDFPQWQRRSISSCVIRAASVALPFSQRYFDSGSRSASEHPDSSTVLPLHPPLLHQTIEVSNAFAHGKHQLLHIQFPTEHDRKHVVGIVGVLTAGGFLLGLGIGTHNVHMVARTMAGAEIGEERITASATTSMRTLGNAFGAALAGMLATIGGLGDVTQAAAVGNAVVFVYGVTLIPLAFAVVFMVWLVRLWTRTEPVASPASPGAPS